MKYNIRVDIIALKVKCERGALWARRGRDEAEGGFKSRQKTPTGKERLRLVASSIQPHFSRIERREILEEQLTGCVGYQFFVSTARASTSSEGRRLNSWAEA